ncbi:putative sugar uptake protein [Philodulcilactobacillus myokoensis]|uniref:Sugar uptake protein n=1 Tax=Philodulcilactobacillus myokoensis TaxID=2929573 RepID=A0A9W6B139_9LACO|nr:GRP family sugar transporter [Philodulcilactobacillus myokoensis]GLB47059.1 putative sugar uptake protein [Philodulcilactobacillus myokoensis]
MNILIGLIPALLWGLMPVAVNKSGGRPINQLIGTTYGAFIIALIVYLIKRPEISASTFWWCLLSGIFWTFGQLTQYTSFTKIGVSTAMPISTGMQLVGNSLIGVLFFGEWNSIEFKIIGFSAIVLIIIGIALTTKTDSDNKINSAALKEGVLLLLFGTFGYAGYSAFPRIANADGWSALFPQILGMLITAVIFSIGLSKQNPVKDSLFSRHSILNMSTGFLFGLAAFVYLISTHLNGVATGFTISQMCVIVSTLSGIFIIGEHKSKRELTFVILGLILVVIGGIMTGNIQ